MIRSRPVQASLAATLSLALAAAPAHALVSIDEGRNQLFLSSALTLGYDSNLFANAVGGGDSFYSLEVGAEVVRRAGLIGVQGSVGVNATQYGQYRGENFQNPRFAAEFTKQTGRTTGSLTLNAARHSRADTAANLRNESWSYSAGLNVKYPVIERYSLAASLGYGLQDFKDNSVLVDIDSYTFSANLLYAFSTDRDLVAGYRYRQEATSADQRNTDHALTVGVSGRIIPRLNGSLRAGYQTRTSEGNGESRFNAVTAAASTTWSYNKRLSVNGQLSKDFSTTSTNVSVDSTTGTVDLRYVLNSRTSFSVGTSAGNSKFLGTLGAGRQDTFWSWNFGASRSITSYLRAAVSYSYFENWSNLSFSDFYRESVSLTLSSRF